MQKIGAVIVAATLMASSAFAATESAPALAPGKPAGVKQAAIAGTPFFWILGLAFVGAGIGLAASGNGGNTPANSTSSTSTSSTAP